MRCFIVLIFLHFSFAAFASSLESLDKYIIEYEVSKREQSQALQLLKDREFELKRSESKLLEVEQKKKKLSSDIDFLIELYATDDSYKPVLSKQKSKLELITAEFNTLNLDVRKLEDRVNLAKFRLETATKNFQANQSALERKISVLSEQNIQEALKQYKKPNPVKLVHVEPCSNNENVDTCKERGKSEASRKAIEMGTEALVSSKTVLENFELKSDLVSTQNEALLVSPIFNTKLNVSGQNQLSWEVSLEASVQGVANDSIITKFKAVQTSKLNNYVFTRTEQLEAQIVNRLPQSNIAQINTSKSNQTDNVDTAKLQTLNASSSQKHYVQSQLNEFLQRLNIDNVLDIENDIKSIKQSYPQFDFEKVDADLRNMKSQRNQFLKSIELVESKLNNKLFFGREGAYVQLKKAKSISPYHSKVTTLENALNQQFYVYVDKLSPDDSIKEIDRATIELGEQDLLLDLKEKKLFLKQRETEKNTYQQLISTYSLAGALYAPENVNAYHYFVELKKLGMTNEEENHLINVFVNKVRKDIKAQELNNADIVFNLQKTIEYFPIYSAEFLPTLTEKLQLLKNSNVQDTPKPKKKKRVVVGGF